jgi:hypothetical protein
VFIISKDMANIPIARDIESRSILLTHKTPVRWTKSIRVLVRIRNSR